MEKGFETFGHHAVVVSQRNPRDDSRRPSSLQWRPSHNARAAARRAIDEEFAVDEKETSSSSRQARGSAASLFSGWIETNAVVLHGKLEFAADCANLDFDRAGA